MLVAQIKNAASASSASSGNFKLFGKEFEMVTIVGIVRSIERLANKMTFIIEDHTGQIETFLWLQGSDENDINMKMPSLVLNAYARVFGLVRNQGDTKVIMIFKIEPLSSLNELTTHLLEVLNVRFMAEEFAKNVSSGGSESGGGGGYNLNVHHQSTSTFNDNSVGGGGATSELGDKSSLDLTGQQLAIYKLIKECKDHHGISTNELHKKFNEMMPLADFE